MTLETARAREYMTEALEALPKLTNYGMGVWDKKLEGKARAASLMEGRRELLSEVEGFIVAWEWLGQIEKIKTINTRHSSYGLKHAAERNRRYVSNGVFIAAAYCRGFEMKTFGDSPNVCFNISERSIAKAERERFPRSRHNLCRVGGGR